MLLGCMVCVDLIGINISDAHGNGQATGDQNNFILFIEDDE